MPGSPTPGSPTLGAADGGALLHVIMDEAPSAECPTGGVRDASGFDDDGNGSATEGRI